MTKQWYIEHGYKVSALIDEAEISRAEKDIELAYIEPIVGDKNVPDEVRDEAVGALVFLLLLQRTIFLTRAGAKTKTGYNSADVDAWAKLQQEAERCHLWLEKLKASAENPSAEVTDICKIYFKTNFISQ